MDNFASAPCIPDDGIEARIPLSPFSVLTLIEVRNRLNATPEILRDSLNLSLAQVYAALAYYHANQATFDTELIRRYGAAQHTLAELFARQEDPNSWGELVGKWPGTETDEEIDAALERLS